MRYGKDHKSATRDRILEVAAAAARRDGLGALSVGAVMGAAGLTHGGFYAHFGSKEELAAAAAERAFDKGSATLRAAVEAAAPQDRLRVFISGYLSRWHRDHPEDGCPFGALGSEIARAGDDLRAVAMPAIGRLMDLARFSLPTATKDPDGAAASLVAAMAGALAMARIFKADPSRSDALLRAARADLISRYSV